jgi:hypothetical protein
VGSSEQQHGATTHEQMTMRLGIDSMSKYRAGGPRGVVLRAIVVVVVRLFVVVRSSIVAVRSQWKTRVCAVAARAKTTMRAGHGYLRESRGSKREISGGGGGG